jgi:pyridoxine 4-dehydrogenase
MGETVTIGGDMTVGRMGFGAMRLTGPGVWGDPADREECAAVLRRAVELGVTFIDTADSYGPFVSEDLIAATLWPYPEGLVIATKGGLTRSGPGRWHPVGRAEYLTQCVEMSLRRLRVDRIDLYQFHRPDPRTPLEESLGALRDLQAQGKIRHIGLSNVTVDEMEQASRVVEVASVQNRYSLTDRSSDDVLARCERAGIAFIPYAPVEGGALDRLGAQQVADVHHATVAQVALAWLLQRSPVMLPIPGTSKVAHLEENMAASALHLSDEDRPVLR